MQHQQSGPERMAQTLCKMSKEARKFVVCRLGKLLLNSSMHCCPCGGAGGRRVCGSLEIWGGVLPIIIIIITAKASTSVSAFSSATSRRKCQKHFNDAATATGTTVPPAFSLLLLLCNIFRIFICHCASETQHRCCSPALDRRKYSPPPHHLPPSTLLTTPQQSQFKQTPSNWKAIFVNPTNPPPPHVNYAPEIGRWSLACCDFLWIESFIIMWALVTGIICLLCKLA